MPFVVIHWRWVSRGWLSQRVRGLHREVPPIQLLHLSDFSSIIINSYQAPLSYAIP
jgi:hypothetical protein